jgi:hypothetical protein
MRAKATGAEVVLCRLMWPVSEKLVCMIACGAQELCRSCSGVVQELFRS